MRTRPKLVLVSWVDSCSDGGWRRSSEPAPEIVQVESVGYLVVRDKKKICLAQSRSLSEDVRPDADRISIPAVAVLSVKYLRVGK